MGYQEAKTLGRIVAPKHHHSNRLRRYSRHHAAIIYHIYELDDEDKCPAHQGFPVPQAISLDSPTQPGKEHIIPDAVSRLASGNNSGHDPEYAKLDALFVYHTTLVQINPDLVKRILDGYNADKWWSKVRKQVLDNKELGVDKALLPFVLAGAQPSDSDPYFRPRPEPASNATLELDSVTPLEKQSPFVEPGTSGLIFHLDRSTGVC